MSDSAVGVSPDVSGLGPLIDTSEVTVGGTAVQRQRVVMADPTDASGLVAVTNAPAVGAYGIVTREALDGPHRDAFGRVRISDPVTLFDSQAQYDTTPLLFNLPVTGAATVTHDAANAAVNLNVTDANGDSALRQSKEYFRYQPGKSQLVLITGQFATGQADMVQEMGYGDAGNGVFVSETNGAVSVVLRTSVSGTPDDNSVAQASWNIDPMDGTGPSGVDLDMTKSQIFVVDLEWLGVGAVRVGFNVDGVTYYVHKFTHANTATGVYMTTANLPVRWKIENTAATAGSATLKSICCSVVSEGGFEDVRGLPFSAATADAGVGSITTSEVFLLALRPAATFNSITNRSTVRFSDVAAWAVDAPVTVRVYYNPTVTGGAWGAVNASSAVEKNTTATLSGGICIATFYVPAAAVNKQSESAARSLISQLPFTLDQAGTNPITLAVTAVRLGGAGTATAGCSIGWREYR